MIRRPKVCPLPVALPPEPAGPTPRVSVIIPVYNQAAFLKEAIDSILAQTWKGFELIVVDDGSTDGSGDIARSYGARVRVFRKTNGGGASAMNLGIREARGEWIAPLSSDDLWEPNKLEAQLREAAAHPEAGLLYTDYITFDLEGRVLGHIDCAPRGNARQNRIYFLRGCYINGSTVLIRRSVLDAVGLYDETERYAPDYDLWLRITAKFPARHVALPLVRYRIHPAQDTWKRPQITRSTFRVVSRAVRKEPLSIGLPAMLLRWRDEVTGLVYRARNVRAASEVRLRLRLLFDTVRIFVDPEAR